jgi:hypothetical protein
MNIESIGKELVNQLGEAAKRLGKDVDLTTARELAQDLAKLLARALVRSEAGYPEALAAASQTLAIRVGIQAADTGDAADAELRGIAQGVLGTAARLLMGVV